jgi:tetratricopeptide (TPR) repeat protein
MRVHHSLWRAPIAALVLLLGHSLGATAGAQRLPGPDAVERAGQRIERGDPDGALAELARLAEGAPRDPRIPYYRGLALARKGKAAAALKAYEQALALKPDLVEAWNNKATLLLEARRLGEALEASDRVVKLRPDLAEGHFNRGLVLEAQGRAADAERAFRRAAELAPRDADIQTKLGGVLLARGDRDGALRAFARAAELAPRDALVRFNHGTTLIDAGRLPEATAELRSAVQLDPRHGRAQQRLAVALMRQRDLDGARAALARARSLLPDDADVLVDLGQLERAAGNAAAAQAALDRAVRQARPGAAGARAFLSRGNLHRSAGRCPAAIRDYREYLSRAPSAKNRARVEGWIAGCR